MTASITLERGTAPSLRHGGTTDREVPDMHTSTLIGSALAALVLATSSVSAQVRSPTTASTRGDSAVQITRAGSLPPSRGPTEWFAGTARRQGRR
jgi:hypothetical protein